MDIRTFAVVVLALCATMAQADENLPMLKANGQVYSNVTVFKVTATDIYFTSPQGLANAKLQNLDPDLQKHFHYNSTPQTATNSANAAHIGQKSATAGASSVGQDDAKVDQTGQGKTAAGSEVGKVLMMVAGVLLLVHLMLCYCFKRICEKCEVEPGLLVWMPVFNAIRMLQAGRLSRWLFILFLIPIVNVAMFLIMWKRICEARGKSPWLILMLFFPVLNLLFVFYLAFSD